MPLPSALNPQNSSKTQSNSANDPDYGALPSHGNGNNVHRPKNDMDDDYGGLPVNASSSRNQTTQNRDIDEEYLDLPPPPQHY
jgi:hypothetical protein